MNNLISHKISCRVYYEDTDAGGVVYYANYLKYAERGRTELLRSIGVENSELLEKQGIGFVVRRLETDYLRSAKLDDEIIVETNIQELGKARCMMQQVIYFKEEDESPQKDICHMMVTLACVNKQGKPVRLPETFVKSVSK